LVQIARKISHLEEDKIILILYDLANDNVCWYNDILSLDKELDGDETYNFVLVLEKHMGLKREKAIETVIYYANEALKEFNKISEINKEHIESNSAFKEFVTGLNDWIIGHYEWCKYTERYNII
jgi:5-epi-alpha-selinene synthase